VMRIFTAISLAMMPERVVFPRPGGPWRSTWSKGSWRSLAASMKMDKFSLAFVCPMYSCKLLGRKLPSAPSSCRRAVVTRGVWLSSWEKSILIRPAPSLHHPAQGLADGAANQSSAVEQLLATVTEVTGQVEENSRATDRLHDNAKSVGAEAEVSRKKIAELMQAMESIKTTSQEINNIIEDIEEIAAQKYL